jgi:hypothetical protein
MKLETVESIFFIGNGCDNISAGANHFEVVRHWGQTSWNRKYKKDTSNLVPIPVPFLCKKKHQCAILNESDNEH